jgi:hypothetical protein
VELFADYELTGLLPLEITYQPGKWQNHMNRKMPKNFASNIVTFFEALEDFGRQLCYQRFMEGKKWMDLRKRTWEHVLPSWKCQLDLFQLALLRSISFTFFTSFTSFTLFDYWSHLDPPRTSSNIA